MKEHIRRILNQDRIWSAYALGDLIEPLYSQCKWIVGENALILLFDPLQPPILLTVGAADEIEQLLSQVPATTYHISIQTEIAAALETTFVVEPLALNRMVLLPEQFPDIDTSQAKLLSQADLGPINTLFALGEATGDMPDGFLAQQLDDELTFGIWGKNGELAAVAGTHLYNPQESVAAVGNVYVHPNYRGQGFGRIATAKVTKQLLHLGVETIVLNVRQHNVVAQRLYEKLGYVNYCEFYEGSCYPK